MKRFKLLIPFILISFTLFAQTNDTDTTDDDFNLFLLLFALAAASLMIGAAIIGSFAATLILFFVFAFVSLGILSASVLAGLYKRSITAAFKTFIYIIGAICGSMIGLAGSWIVFKSIHLDVPRTTAITTGLMAGFTGGLLMAYAIVRIFPILIRRFRERYLQQLIK